MYNEKNIQEFTSRDTPLPDEPTMLSMSVGCLEKHNAQIAELTRTLNRTVDRLIGSEPQDAQESKGVSVGNGLCRELERHVCDQQVLIGQLESAIRRLSVV